MADYLELLAQMHRLDPELRRAELYVCTAPLMMLGMGVWDILVGFLWISGEISDDFMDFSSKIWDFHGNS